MHQIVYFKLFWKESVLDSRNVINQTIDFCHKQIFEEVCGWNLWNQICLNCAIFPFLQQYRCEINNIKVISYEKIYFVETNLALRRPAYQRAQLPAHQQVEFSEMPKLLSFYYFELRIKLIPSQNKKKILYLNTQPTDSQSGVVIITPKSQL